MARTQVKPANAGCMAAIVLVAILAVLGPLALAAWSVFCELRALFGKSANSMSEVLTDAEVAELDLVENDVDRVNRDINVQYQQGLAAGCIQRADGLFDERRYQARDINMALQGLLQRQNSLQGQRDVIRQRLAQRVSKWLDAKSSLFASRAALLTFVVTFAGFQIATGGGHSISGLIFGEPGATSGRMSASLLAITLAIIAMLITRSTVRASLAK